MQHAEKRLNVKAFKQLLRSAGTLIEVAKVDEGLNILSLGFTDGGYAAGVLGGFYNDIKQLE
jgi:hypothetical protein